MGNAYKTFGNIFSMIHTMWKCYIQILCSAKHVTQVATCTVQIINNDYPPVAFLRLQW